MSGEAKGEEILDRLEKRARQDRDDFHDIIKQHYISWRAMLGILATIAALYAYTTPRIISYETRSIDQKLDQIVGLLNKH